MLSTLRYFRDEYEAHVMESRCPAGVCQGLRVYDIEPGLCTAAACAPQTAPARRSSASASFAHAIIVDRCSGCGACAEACPKQAVRAVA